MSRGVDTDTGWLIDSYREWVAAEKVSFVEDFCVDLRTTEVDWWARFGVRGAIVNVKGRGEFLDLWLLEIPPGASTDPVHHLFEGVTYVISGSGRTDVKTFAGAQTFEWGPASMFATPINAEYRYHNTSSIEPARVAIVTSCPTLMNLFYSEEAVFNSDYQFPERLFAAELQTPGRLVAPKIAGRVNQIWRANRVPDLGQFADMQPNEYRGGGNTIFFSLGESALHAHMSDIPVGQYKKGHRHPAGYHIFPVTGRGYSLLWYEGDTEFRRVDWEHGIVYAPPDSMYHQHFNVDFVPARYLAVTYGSRRHPFTRSNYLRLGAEERVAGKFQIEYEEEDPRIAQMFSDELEHQRGAPR